MATKERPILFNGEMVRAILNERKTQTRWVIKPQPERIPDDVDKVRGDNGWWWSSSSGGSMIQMRQMPCVCPLGKPGDRLWVQERWALRTSHYNDPYSCVFYHDGSTKPIHRREGHNIEQKYGSGLSNLHSWRNPTHMPRWASRILLEVVKVRVERVQDISEEDVQAEGIVPISWDERNDAGEMFTEVFYSADDFKRDWNDIYAKCGHGWDVNPWVWVVEFELISAAPSGKER